LVRTTPPLTPAAFLFAQRPRALKHGIGARLVEEVRGTAAWLRQEPQNGALTAISSERRMRPAGAGAPVRAFRLRLSAVAAAAAGEPLGKKTGRGFARPAFSFAKAEVA
jgi:hypothetical protein